MGRLRNTDLGISRPASSFAFFVQHCHQRFKAVKKKLRLREKSYAQVPDASNIATRWRTMASPERRPFVEKAQQEAARNRSQRKKTLHDVRCVKLTKQTKGPSASSFTHTEEVYPFDMEHLLVSPSVLGSGTYGVVKLASSSLTSTCFAVKFAKTTSAKGLEHSSAKGRTAIAEQDLVHEKAFLSSFTSPHIVRCFGLVAQGTTLGLVMELCHCTLSQWLNENPLACKPPENQVSQRDRFFLQLAVGLSYIHEHKVLHLDIKPNNCLLSEDNQSIFTLKLSDFGLAVHCPSSGAEVVGKCVYNACYRPPECDIKAKAGGFIFQPWLTQL